MERKGIKQPGDNWIYSYYQGIKDGTYTVSKWIRLVYEHLVHGVERKEFFYDAKKANAAVEWIETHCFHTEGPLAEKPLKLEVWQKAFIASIFGIVDANGFRQFREVVLLVARKNGKTKLAASIAAYMWRLEGGFGTKVFCIAPKLDQADLVYNDVWMMTQLDPEWQAMKEELSEKDMHNKKVKDDSMLPKKRQTELAIPGANSTIKKIAFAAKRSDGFNPALAIMDEVAAWPGSQGIQQFEVMKSGMGARPEGVLLSCTTSGYISDGIYDELIKRSTRFLLGDSKEKKLLPFLYMIDDVSRWNDVNELRKSNPNLGISIPVDYIIEEVAIAEGSLSRKSEFMCKIANIKQNSSLAWLDAPTIEKASGDHLDPEDFRGSYCVGGIDLSRTTDLTACVAVIEKDGELYVLANFYLPAEKIEEAALADGVPYGQYVQRGLLTPSGDNFIDYHDCYDWFVSLVEEYELLPLQVGYDRYSAQYLVSDMKEYGFHMDDVFQGTNLHPVLMEFEGLLKDGKIHIGDNDLLKIHLYNAALKYDTNRDRAKLVKLNAAGHIDGLAALIDAMTVRQKWWNEIGAQLVNE